MNITSRTERKKLNSVFLFDSGLIRFPTDFMLPNAFAAQSCLGFMEPFETDRQECRVAVWEEAGLCEQGAL